MRSLYLDHNSTTTLLPEAWDAMRAAPPGNPASAHHLGRTARRALEDARETVAGLLGALPDEVTFTSGATEANNLALFGMADAWRAGRASRPVPDPSAGSLRPLAVASPIEHPCVTEPLRHLAARGFDLDWLPVTPQGIVEPTTTVSHASLVSVMLVNHETGAVQPVRDIAVSLPPGALFHCDASQAVGKLPVSLRDLGVSALTASAHKFRGPKGVGLLLVKRGTPLHPLFFGGHQQHGRRPGTEPVPLVVGMAVALEHAVRNLDANRRHLDAVRALLWEQLQSLASPVVLNGPEPGSPNVLPTTLNVSFPGCRADLLLMALDLAGVACSAGSACSSGSLLPSPVLRAMGVPEEVLRSALRFSFGPDTGLADINDAASRIAAAVNRIRGGSEPAR